MVVGAMEDRIKKELKRKEKSERKQFYIKKKKKKPSKKQIVRAIKLSHQLDTNYFNMFK